MGASKQETTSHQNTGPWQPFQQPIINSIPLIQNDMGNMANWSLYGGDYGNKSAVAGFTDPQTQAMDAIKGIATAGNGVTGNAVDWAKGVLSPDFLSGNNPAWAGLSKAIADPIQAATSAQFGRAGRGAAGGEAGDTGLAGTMDRNIATGLSPAAMQFMQLQQSTAGMAPALDAARYNDAEKLYGVGSLEQEMTQQQIQDAIARSQFAQGRSSTALQTYLDRLRGLGSMGSEGDSTSTTVNTPSGLQTGMGIGMMGLGAMTGNPMLMAGGASGLAGGAGGSRFKLPWMPG